MVKITQNIFDCAPFELSHLKKASSFNDTKYIAVFMTVARSRFSIRSITVISLSSRYKMNVYHMAVTHKDGELQNSRI